jgi:hypothetical protein
LNGLVEQQDLWIVNECSRDLDALPHTLRVRADAPMLRRLELDERDGTRRRAVDVVEMLQARAHPHELVSREKRVHCLALGHERQRPIDVRSSCRGQTVDQHADRPMVRGARQSC